MLVKLPATSLQASNFTKNELLYTYFLGFQLNFKLLLCFRIPRTLIFQRWFLLVLVITHTVVYSVS